MKWKISIITKKESDLFKKIEEGNQEDVALWKLPNLIIPLGAIILSIVALFAFDKDDRGHIYSYYGLLLNGAIPLIALNQLSTLGLFIFKYDKSKEKELGIFDTSYLRTKLFFGFLGILIGNLILYIYQVLETPNEHILIIFILFISLLGLYYSSVISKKIFLLQDKLLEASFYDEVHNTVENTINRWESKFGKK